MNQLNILNITIEAMLAGLITTRGALMIINSCGYVVVGVTFIDGHPCLVLAGKM